MATETGKQLGKEAIANTSKDLKQASSSPSQSLSKHK